MKRLPLFVSFILFIALCVSAAYWTIQFLKPPVRAVAAPPQVPQPAPTPDAAVGLFGGRSSVAVTSNFQLKGVVFAGNPAESVAILSANGKPARSVKVNGEVVPGVTVQQVQQGYVLLSENGVTKRVDLPVRAKAPLEVGVSTSTAGPGSPPSNNPAQSNSPKSLGDNSDRRKSIPPSPPLPATQENLQEGDVH
jgi:general secretion pathway protein C